MENVRASSVGVATTLTGLLSVSPSSMPQSTDIVGKERARRGVAGGWGRRGERGTSHYISTIQLDVARYSIMYTSTDLDQARLASIVIEVYLQ